MATRNLKTMKENILREIGNAKTEILEEFLCKAKQIEGYLNLLDQEGIDRDRFICLEGYQEWKDISYSVVEKQNVIAILAELRGMKKDKEAITKQFERIESKEFCMILLNYDEYTEMQRMEDAYNAMERAEEEMESLIL